MSVLVDTSIWVDYFKSGANSGKLDALIDQNQPVINEIVLAELVPFLLLKKQFNIVEILKSMTLLPLNINWTEVIQWQTACLHSGINGIGIPDLLIAQNAKQHRCSIYTLDKHFRLLNEVTDIQLFE